MPQVVCFQNLSHFDITFNLIESPPSYILESCSASAIFAWLSKWQFANQTGILQFSRANLFEVPLEFASLNAQSLTEIDLRSNQISMIPDTLTRFYSLTTLLLNDNKLQYIPNPVFSLSKLQVLDVRDNCITGNSVVFFVSMNTIDDSIFTDS